MNDLAKNALSNVYLVVRMVPGGVLALLIVLADRSDQSKIREVLLTGSDIWWKIVIAGAFLGIVAHAFFSTVMEDVVMIPAIQWIRRRNPGDVPQELLSASADDFIRTLFRERAARRSTKDDNVRAVQDALDRDYNFHIFLYCTVLLLIFSQVLTLFWSLGFRVFDIVWLIFVWGVAFRSDVNLTRHEAWLVKHYSQWKFSVPVAQTAPAAAEGVDQPFPSADCDATVEPSEVSNIVPARPEPKE